MAETSRKPKIRFVGFTEDWEQRKFGDIVTPYADPVPTPTDGYYRLGMRSHAKGTFHNYVKPGMELGTAQMHRVAADKFIVNITFGWEHAVAITDENDAEKLVSHRFPQFSFNIGMVPDFFKFVIMDENFRHHLWLASPGGAGRNRVLKINEMLEYKFWVPSANEQRRIAVFLENLDRLITLHQRKRDRLGNIKKAMLEKMFPKNGADVPEVRFAGFTEAWEQRKLGDLAEQTFGGGTPSTANANFWSGNIPWIQSSDLSDGNLFDVEPKKYISDLAVKFSATKIIPRNSIAIIIRVGVGKLALLPFSYSTSQDFLSISRLTVDEIFISYSIYKKIQEELSLVQGTSIKGITKQELLAKGLLIPSNIVEQAHIGTFFRHLDRLITLHQRKVQLLQNIKKACLEMMFV